MGKHMDAAGIEFLFAEVQCELMFANCAISANPRDTETIARNRRNAHKAYDTLLRFRERPFLSETESAKLNSGIRNLEPALCVLGDILDDHLV